MDDMLRNFFLCFGLVFGLVPLAICLFLWMKIQTLRDRVHVLEVRLADTAREWWNWANGMTAHVKSLAPAGAMGVPAGAGPEAAPQPAAPHVTPFVKRRRSRGLPLRPHLRRLFRNRRPCRGPRNICVSTSMNCGTNPPRRSRRHPPCTATRCPRGTGTRGSAIQPAAPQQPVAPKPAAAAPVAAPAYVADQPPVKPPASKVQANKPAPAARGKGGLEAYLGMKLFVVIGAIALAGSTLPRQDRLRPRRFGPAMRDIATLSAGVFLWPSDNGVGVSRVLVQGHDGRRDHLALRGPLCRTTTFHARRAGA